MPNTTSTNLWQIDEVTTIRLCVDLITDSKGLSRPCLSTKTKHERAAALSTIPSLRPVSPPQGSMRQDASSLLSLLRCKSGVYSRSCPPSTWKEKGVWSSDLQIEKPKHDWTRRVDWQLGKSIYRYKPWRRAPWHEDVEFQWFERDRSAWGQSGVTQLSEYRPIPHKSCDWPSITRDLFRCSAFNISHSGADKIKLGRRAPINPRKYCYLIPSRRSLLLQALPNLAHYPRNCFTLFPR